MSKLPVKIHNIYPIVSSKDPREYRRLIYTDSNFHILPVGVGKYIIMVNPPINNAGEEVDTKGQIDLDVTIPNGSETEEIRDRIHDFAEYLCELLKSQIQNDDHEEPNTR